MLELLLDPQAWIALVTLIALELVLGIDNIIFISIRVDQLPRKRREFARMMGLFLAMFMRVALLLLLSWVVRLVTPLFTLLGQEISGRDLILIADGVFIIWKSTKEIHQLLAGGGHEAWTARGASAGAVQASRPRRLIAAPARFGS
jgi:predicted tellurium resistance membrane protein TerC